jgi:protoporphyrinogen oxidase
MYYCFGRGITEKYLLPYNRKIWKTEPRAMGVEWVERIPRPPMEDVVRSALGFETEGYTHQLFFRYPHQGGVQALVTALIDDAAKVRCKFPVRRIRRNGGKWTVSNGQEDRDYDEIVVAFPIHEAAKCFDSTPAAVRDALERLRYNSLYVAMIGLNDETLMDKSAIYLPDPEILPHRVCFMGFFSKTMVPQGHSSLIAEITCPPGGEIDRAGKDWVLERAIGDLDRAGVIRRENVVATDIRRVEYAYPVYNLDYARSVRTVREYYASIGVHLLGRFAEFDYINSDECLRRAVDLAERLNQAKR